MTILSIVNADNVSEMIRNANIIFVDIDDVLIRPERYVCSSHWCQNFRKLHANTIGALSFIDAIYLCMSRSSFVKVDATLIDTLNNIRTNTDCLILGLTARIIDFSKQTNEWTYSTGIRFSQIEELESMDFYYKGIIFSGYDAVTGIQKNKGALAQKIVKQLSPEAKKVVLIDDSIIHNEELENIFTATGIEFIGIHFEKVVKSCGYYGQYTSDELSQIGSAQFEYIKNDRIYIPEEHLIAASIWQCHA